MFAPLPAPFLYKEGPLSTPFPYTEVPLPTPFLYTEEPLPASFLFTEEPLPASFLYTGGGLLTTFLYTEGGSARALSLPLLSSEKGIVHLNDNTVYHNDSDEPSPFSTEMMCPTVGNTVGTQGGSCGSGHGFHVQILDMAFPRALQ